VDNADFAAMIVPVAKQLWGDPSSTQGNKLRWGNNGARVVNVDKGVWSDFEIDDGGGVIDLVQMDQNTDKEGALQWLRDNGYLHSHNKEHLDDLPRASNDELPVEPERPKGKFTVVKSWDYFAHGRLMYQVRRVQFKLPDGSFELTKGGKVKKSFVQCRPTGLPDGSFAWGLKPGKYMRDSDRGGDWRAYDAKKAEGRRIETHMLHGEIPHCLYRSNEIEIAIEAGEPVFLVEGEKAADALVGLGFEATCNSGGAEKFHDGLVSTFKHANVVVLPDNDPQSVDKDGNLLFHPDGRPKHTGQDHAKTVANKIRRVAASVKVLELPDLPPKGDVYDWIENGGTSEQLQALADKAEVWVPSTPNSIFGAIQAKDISGKKIKHDWLVRDIVERHAVFMVAGPSQSGKTFVTIDMAMRIARGEEFLKKRVKQGLVIYQAGEDANGVIMRIEGFRRDKNIPENEDIPLVVLPGKLHLTSDESVDAFIKECQAWSDYYNQKIEAIFIDTFKKATTGMEEISGKEVGAVIERLERISKLCMATVGVVHHMTKDGGSVRGHSSLYDDLQNVILLSKMHERPKNKFDKPPVIRDQDRREVRKIRLDKIKNGVQRDICKFVLRKVDLGLDDEGEPLATCVLDNPAKHKEAGKENGEYLSDNLQVIMDALRMATEESGVPVPTGVTIGSHVKRVCPEKYFVGAVRRLWAFNASIDDPEARKKELIGVLSRNVQKLVAKGYVGRDNDKGVLWTIKSPHKTEQPQPPEDEPTPPPLPDDVRRAADDDMPF
jgi:hypothetical protein